MIRHGLWKRWAALLPVVVLLAFAPHPLHLTLTEVNYNAPELTLEISHRIFLDDLSAALERQCHCAVSTEAARPSPNLDSLVQRYVAQHVQLKVDGRPLVPRFLGHEFDGEALWVHYEVNDVRPFAQLGITQQLLFELYDDQSTLVNFTCSGKLRSARLLQGRPTATLTCHD